MAPATLGKVKLRLKRRNASAAPDAQARRHVYVVGAGFSAGLNYPLVSDLLIRLWPQLDATDRSALEQIVAFHHPSFDPKRATSFPNIETLLSEMMANEQMWDASRSAPGGFTLKTLQDARQNLLLTLAKWFHLLYEPTATDPPAWLLKFANKVRDEEAVIISFNWDLVLEQQLFGESITPEQYGFGAKRSKTAFLLKPHGSLNWYAGKLGRKIKVEKRELLFEQENSELYRFKFSRSPKGKQSYMPLIVPPVFNKSFADPVFTLLWQRCVSVLSTASKVTFLGYSLPEADLHARFILRCGFQNQIDGELSATGKRSTPTGPAEVIIVNPDVNAARRIEGTIGSECSWAPTTAERWIAEDL